MSPRLFLPTLGVLLFLLTGCTPPPTSLPAILPTARVQVTHNPLPSPTMTVSPQATTSLVTITDFPSSSLQDIAMQTYGDRLILRIQLPSISVDSPVVTVGWQVAGTPTQSGSSAEWDSPGSAVGWVLTSALPDQDGNIILYGHNNMYGSVFKELGKLEPGDEVLLQTGQGTWQFQVDRVLLLPVLNADSAQRQAYLAYLAETDQPRLTLISCWPPTSNIYRVVVIAYPVLAH